MSTNDFSSENVLVVTFGEDPKNDTNAYQALTDLKQLDSQGQTHIIGAAVVTRDLDGRVDGYVEIEHVQSDAGAHFLTERGPNALTWDVNIDLGGQRLHNDQNRITLDAFE